MPRPTPICGKALRHPSVDGITSAVSHQPAICEFNHSGVNTSDPSALLTVGKFRNRLSGSWIEPCVAIVVAEPYRRATVSTGYCIASEEDRAVLSSEDRGDRHVSEAVFR